LINDSKISCNAHTIEQIMKEIKILQMKGFIDVDLMEIRTILNKNESTTWNLKDALNLYYEKNTNSKYLWE